MIQAVRKVVHEGASPDEAYELYQDLKSDLAAETTTTGA
jgi:hypothetical protein